MDILKIIYEDDCILVIDKPAGLMVQPDRMQNPSLLEKVKEYLKYKSNLDIYAQHIHRLDRPVCGLVLFAKQRAVLHNLSNQFAERIVQKKYHAITYNAPNERVGTLFNYHRKEKKLAKIYDSEIEYSVSVSLDYEISDLPNNYYLWNIKLNTGKFHQIRAQLSHKGCPILGDKKYNSTQSYFPDAIALQAVSLQIKHPLTDEDLVFKSTYSLIRVPNTNLGPQ